MPATKPPERLMAAIPGLQRFLPAYKSFLDFLAERIAEDFVRDIREGRLDPKDLERPPPEPPQSARKRDAPEEPRMLNAIEVECLTGLSRSEFSRLERDGWFPRRDRQGRRTTWLKSEVDDWVVLWQRRVPLPVKIRIAIRQPASRRSRSRP